MSSKKKFSILQIKKFKPQKPQKVTNATIYVTYSAEFNYSKQTRKKYNKLKYIITVKTNKQATGNEREAQKGYNPIKMTPKDSSSIKLNVVMKNHQNVCNSIRLSIILSHYYLDFLSVWTMMFCLHIVLLVIWSVDNWISLMNLLMFILCVG